MTVYDTAGSAAIADATITTLTSELETAITSVNSAAGTMAATTKRLQTQNEFLTKLSDIKSSALGTLINADLDEESARLSSLQVQQQLATTALSIVNQSRSNILRLFQ